MTPMIVDTPIEQTTFLKVDERDSNFLSPLINGEKQGSVAKIGGSQR